MIKTLVGLLSIMLLFTACDNKSSFDESLVAKTEVVEEKPFEPVDYALTTVDAKIIEFQSTPEGFNFNDYKGKKAVLIDVFATWCPPCIEDIPVFKELREKYKDDFEIVSVLFEKDKPLEEVLEFINKYNIPYPVTIGEENFVLAKDLGDIQKIPEKFLFSKDGEFIKKFVGNTSKESLEQYIKIAIEN
ncbi:hypothetical protein GCM10012288_21740 [Malaciobacter pacificus]|uniref:Protein disulfide reductase, TlpA family n=1 Tax=Malaciobacter pacificus TaxID=1080223 RepID=A0A5C2H537_9BACT|nr:TlpA disulfide reductase family protein [Malaciobacter pacificus]QEP34130.1 protein disulfide reductase, TlpA family [Malaciobacter pacificus]GGD47163.1 hypothetical protein GCM10012288_21740 [Malaciobacter pacificus]